MPALIIVVHIIVQDRRYIFIEQAGCIPSISPSLFPLVAVLIWPVLFNVASLAYLGLLVHSIRTKRRKEGVTPTSTETMTRERLLRVSISLFLGTVCTSSIALFLLLRITSNSQISVDSLHHDFQTVYIITADQWTRNPWLRTAVELRWLWASLSVVLGIGLFPKERIGQVVGWFASVKMYIRMRRWHRSALNSVCHGSLPVYISRTPSPSYSDVPIIPSLPRLSTLAPTFGSRVSSMLYQPEVIPPVPVLDTRSKSQVWETVRPNVPPEPQEASRSDEFR